MTKPLTPDEATAKLRAALESGATISYATGEKVWAYPDTLTRCMQVLLGSNDPRFFVSDLSHLSDFGADESDLDALAVEFGVRLPTVDLFIWEMVWLLAPKRAS